MDDSAVMNLYKPLTLSMCRWNLALGFDSIEQQRAQVTELQLRGGGYESAMLDCLGLSDTAPDGGNMLPRTEVWTLEWGNLLPGTVGDPERMIFEGEKANQ